MIPRPDVLLRVVAVVAFIQFAGHGTLFVRARPTHGPAEMAVVAAMKGARFRFAAAPRSYVAHLAMLARYFAFPLPMVFDGIIAAGLIAVAALTGAA